MSLRGSGYELFGQRRFRSLWAANFVSYFCLVMLTLGVSWTMTSLTDSPVLVSMVQTVTSLPFLVFSVPAGIAADSLGHRTVLLAAQLWMLLIVGLMGFIGLYGGWEFTPPLLLSTMFLVGVGVVAQQAAWKPFVQDLVGEDRLIAAISFNSLSSDLGRAAGPVIGGFLMGVWGTAVVLFTSAASQLIMIATLLTVGKPTGSAVQSEIAGSVRDGWAVLRRSPSVYGPMIRCALLMVPCGGVLGLLPLEAKENIQTGPIGYGGLLAALAIGTAAGGALIPLLRRRFGLAALTTVCLCAFSVALLAVSQWDSMALDAAFLLVLGLSWSVLSIAHQFAIQLAAPDALRGLLTAVYVLVLQGSMAAGSLGFGLLAQHAGVSRAIFAAGLLAMSGLLLVRRYRLPDGVSEVSAS